MKQAENAPAEYSVSEYVHLLKERVEQNLTRSRVCGEVGQISRPRSGHIYLSLKDEQSEISVVSWKAFVERGGFVPREGDQISCRGYSTVYPARGRLQFIAEFMQPAGEGVLLREFERLKAKLEAEGLFSDERKRELPFLPSSIGVITSASGAVIHDIAVRVRARFPKLKVALYDARVQGEGADREIISGIKAFNKLGKVDVIVVARGGGSLEDLWCFNSEALVRAVVSSKIPVVSAVGHETDITLCDLAADLRAPTPTAAAELIAPEVSKLKRELDQVESRLFRTNLALLHKSQSVDELARSLELSLSSWLRERRDSLTRLSYAVALCDPSQFIASYSQSLERSSLRLSRSGSRQIERLSERLSNASLRVRASMRGLPLSERAQSLNRLSRSMERASSQLSKEHVERLQNLSQRLEQLHPEKTLARGFAMLRRAGEVISDGSRLQPGDELEVEMRDGKFELHRK